MFIVEILKSRCNFLTLWGSTCSKKKVGWEVIFSELGFAGSGARKPRWEFEGSALEPFFHVFLSLNGVFYCVVKLPHKSQCKTYRICQGKSNHTLARCVFFYQHCFTKIIEAYCCEEKHMINTIGKKMHTLVKKTHTTLS